MPARIVGVIDIGETYAKVAVVDLDLHQEIDARKRPNSVVNDAPYPHYDATSLWEFVQDSLNALSTEHNLDALSVTTHGATAALVAADGTLALPVLDNLFSGPDTLRGEYDRLRPDFSQTFTPRLPGGLNLGAQFYWQSQTFPRQWAATRWLLTYPQYWSFLLTGVPSSELTSLGCHTDLWDLETDLFSSLVRRQNWLERFPDVRSAADVLGLVRPELCARLGLRSRMPVHVGIHNSNASLLPHLLEHETPFSVVSTGLWIVAIAPGGDLAALDPARDCLANIDAYGHPLPSARFMGGREFDLITGGQSPAHIGDAAMARVLDDRIMLMPSVVTGSGPFPTSRAHWNRSEAMIDSEARYVAASFYLALMTAECLSLTGADGNTVVEGPLAANRLYVEMLASATGRPVEPMNPTESGTAIGAALLARMRDGEPSEAVAPLVGSARMAVYARKWRAAAAK